jgi:hypothetical protein
MASTMQGKSSSPSKTGTPITSRRGNEMADIEAHKLKELFESQELRDPYKITAVPRDV